MSTKHLYIRGEKMYNKNDYICHAEQEFRDNWVVEETAGPIWKIIPAKNELQ